MTCWGELKSRVKIAGHTYLKHGFTIHCEWIVNRKRVLHCQLCAPMEEGGVGGELGDATERRGMTIRKRVSIFFPPPLNGCLVKTHVGHVKRAQFLCQKGEKAIVTQALAEKTR